MSSFEALLQHAPTQQQQIVEEKQGQSSAVFYLSIFAFSSKLHYAQHFCDLGLTYASLPHLIEVDLLYLYHVCSSPSKHTCYNLKENSKCKRDIPASKQILAKMHFCKRYTLNTRPWTLCTLLTKLILQMGDDDIIQLLFWSSSMHGLFAECFFVLLGFLSPKENTITIVFSLLG